MMERSVTQQLELIASDDDFASRSDELTEAWTTAGIGLEAVGEILVFMEGHPSIDYGLPGALVRFVERFYKKGYEERLVESVAKKPTPHTVWMLNRVINGTKEPAVRESFIRTMQQARQNPAADKSTVQLIDRLLEA